MLAKERYLEQYSKDEPQWLKERRKESYELFKKRSMPSFIYGLNIHLKIGLNLDDIDPTKGKIEQTIIDSSKIKTHNQKTNHETLKTHFMQLIPPLDKFSAFHSSFVKNIAVLTIPKNEEIPEPIEINSLMEGNCFDHLIIIAEENSKAIIVENLVSKKAAYVSKMVEIFMHRNSKLDYGCVQELDKGAFQYVIKRASLENDARLNWLDFCFGTSISLSEVSTHLNGQGSEANNHGMFFGSKNQQFDIVNHSIHNAPNTVSDILTKGALRDASKCLYRGLVKINKNAPKSNGYQKQDTLLLSSDAAADSIPNLEIENSDVRCTHGATIGKIDQEKLFYLQSRGLSKEEATREYVKGYFEPLIQKMKIEPLRANMHSFIDKLTHGQI